MTPGRGKFHIPLLRIDGKLAKKKKKKEKRKKKRKEKNQKGRKKSSSTVNQQDLTRCFIQQKQNTHSFQVPTERYPGREHLVHETNFNRFKKS